MTDKFEISLVIWMWLLVLVLNSCSPAMIVHDPDELIVLSIDHKNGTVLMQGELLNPKGLYYVTYPINRFGYIEEGMKFRLTQMK